MKVRLHAGTREEWIVETGYLCIKDSCTIFEGLPPDFDLSIPISMRELKVVAKGLFIGAVNPNGK